LLARRRPTDIAYFVVSVVLDAMERMAFRALAEMRVKLLD
jgi:hypothetical protein